jgi:hypothetical protein
MTMFNVTRVGVVAVVAAALLSATSCGGDSSSGDSTESTEPKLVQATLAEPEGCFLTVYMADEATRPQVGQVETLLLSNPRILEVAYVSKRLALRRLAQTRPEFVRQLTRNPLPARFEVVPGTRSDVFAIITEFARGVRGVTNVRASPPCQLVPSLIPRD